MRLFLSLLTTAIISRIACAEMAPAMLPPDDRYKTDLLLVVAHPDDDVVVGGYLARIALDEHKRVAVIYCTPGDGGGNAVGNDAGTALGKVRMIEARRALASYGIFNAWFLNGHDTPGQNVLWSLDGWGHGKALDEIVRLMRITRPEVVLTWLPSYVVGENHGDHQAAGVLATEAFDIAGDPMQFPEQITPPRNRTGMSNRTEGLQPWQPKKLYFATDAFEDFGPYWHDTKDLSPYRKNFLDGVGPSYPSTDTSPARHETYAKLTAEYQTFYMTQEGYLGVDALKSGDLTGFNYPDRLLFGKSLVGGSVTGDVFENIKAGRIPEPPASTLDAVRTTDEGLKLSLGGPWAFYRWFWMRHSLQTQLAFSKVPEVSVRAGDALTIPLVLKNNTKTSAEITLNAKLPAGWVNKTAFSRYPVKAGESYSVDAVVATPADAPRWQEITWTAEANGKGAGEVTLRVHLGKEGGLPQ